VCNDRLVPGTSTAATTSTSTTTAIASTSTTAAVITSTSTISATITNTRESVNNYQACYLNNLQDIEIKNK